MKSQHRFVSSIAPPTSHKRRHFSQTSPKAYCQNIHNNWKKIKWYFALLWVKRTDKNHETRWLKVAVFESTNDGWTKVGNMFSTYEIWIQGSQLREKYRKQTAHLVGTPCTCRPRAGVMRARHDGWNDVKTVMQVAWRQQNAMSFINHCTFTSQSVSRGTKWRKCGTGRSGPLFSGQDQRRPLIFFAQSLSRFVDRFGTNGMHSCFPICMFFEKFWTSGARAGNVDYTGNVRSTPNLATIKVISFSTRNHKLFESNFEKWSGVICEIHCQLAIAWPAHLAYSP